MKPVETYKDLITIAECLQNQEKKTTSYLFSLFQI